MQYPETITVRFLKSERTGLLAAISDDIPGLTITGRTIEAIKADIPPVLVAIIKEQYGDDVEVEMCDSPLDVPGFVPLSPVSDWARARIDLAH